MMPESPDLPAQHAAAPSTAATTASASTLNHRAVPARRVLLTGLIGLGASACSLLPEQHPDPEPDPAVPADRPAAIPLFSRVPAGASIPSGWQPWTLHRNKRPTRYQLVSDAGTTVLQADADRSASGLITRMNMEVRFDTTLSWRWRVRSLIDDADPAVGSRDDAPVRLALAFDGDHASLPLRDRLFAERVKLLAGHELPYATLMYIWAAVSPPGTRIDNPHTGRIRKLVVDAGSAHLGQWRWHARQIEADFHAVFGEPPGRLRAVALMTDTDNTASTARAYYGDIVLG